MVGIRSVKLSDLPVIAELMHQALEPYYGGDHRAHAKRIVETAARGARDRKGHFSAEQHMYVAEEDGNILGILNFVVKYQGTLKISPLIIREEARGKGLSRLLLQKMDRYAKKNRIRQIYCTVSAKNKVALEYFLVVPSLSHTIGHATIAPMHSGRHHLHIRKRMYKNLEKFPHPRIFVRTLDYIVYVAGFLGPAMTVPQIVLIYATHDAGNVSALSWGAYALFDIPWVLYGVAHKESLITYTYTLWFFANMLVAVGALIY